MSMLKVTTEYVNGLPSVSYEKTNDECMKVVETIGEDDMVAIIMDAVDNAPIDHTFNHDGETHYEIDVPILKLDCGSYYWDNETKTDTYKPLYIIRRPEDTENKDDINYIYDVYMEMNNDTTYVESLECVGVGILSAIYSYVAGNR